MKNLRLNIEGMSCGHCVGRVKEALAGLQGVAEVDVSLDENSARIQTQDDFDVNAAITAVKQAGYEATAA